MLQSPARLLAASHLECYRTWDLTDAGKPGIPSPADQIGEEGHACKETVETLEACYAELAPEPLSEEFCQERFSDSSPDTPAAASADPTGLAAATAVVRAAAGKAGDGDGARGKPARGPGTPPTKGVAQLSLKSGAAADGAKGLKGASGSGSNSGQSLSAKGGGGSSPALRSSSATGDKPPSR